MAAEAGLPRRPRGRGGAGGPTGGARGGGGRAGAKELPASPDTAVGAYTCSATYGFEQNPKGKYSNVLGITGANECIDCPKGRYNNMSGSQNINL